jgi:hypothetical protein
MSIHDFNEIRPYSGDEIKEAIKRIVEAPELEAVANFLLPGEDLEKLKEGIRSSKTKHEFQINLMDKVMRAIAARYTDGITSEGIEDLETGEASLFLANHRDIILDSSFLAMLMLEKGYKTSEMTWGDNLMVTPFIVDVGKVNGMITVFRDGTPRELLKNSQRLSAYIRNAIVERKESVWIAHHKGRAKDGNDKTDVSVIKMLLLSGENSPKEKLLELNIRTVTISYEWEPCDARKVNELYHSKNKVYVKDKMEDLESIIGGVLAPKGRVHLVMSKPLTDKIKEVPGNLNTNETAAKVAEIVDLQINRDYKLWPSNYLAYDILNKSSRFAVKYGDDVKDRLEERYKNTVKLVGIDNREIRDLFLTIYANPVANKLKNGFL